MAEVSNTKIVSEIKEALNSIRYGSLEIIVQDGKVTQMTRRQIEKITQSKEDKN